MKKAVIAILFSFFLLVIPLSSIFAQDNFQTNTTTTNIVKVSSSEVVDKDYFLAAEEIVEISGVVNGDVIIAAGQVMVDGVVNGDLLVVGGTVSISGDVSQDLRVVGGQVTLSGTVGQNLTAVGGNVEITDGAEISGAALVAGGNIFVSGPVGGELYVGAGNLIVSNVVDGNVEAAAGTIQITSKANIMGDFTYVSDTEAIVDSNATIAGVLERSQLPETIRSRQVDEAQKSMQKAQSAGRLISFISALVFGVFMIRYFPNYVSNVSSVVRVNLWKSLGVGFLSLFAAPFAAIILISTVIGLPFGLLIIVILGIYMYLAKIFIAFCIGDYLFEKIKRKKTQYLPFVLGLVVYYVLRYLPYIGGLTGFVVLLLGLGAAILQYKDFYKKALKAKVI